MACISAVGVNNDLTACQTAVTLRSADYKAACGIDKELRILIHHMSRQDFIKYILLNIGMNLLLCSLLVVLCGQYDRIETDRFVVFIVFHGNLSLSVRSQIGKSTVFADFCQAARQLVSQSNRIRHVFFRFIGCKTEHHTLIACTDCFDFFVAHGIFFCFQRLINTHGDIR